MNENTLTLYRPVGLAEAELILKLERFPPRKPEQPIFYPVLNREYAEQIAHDWNTKDLHSGYAGFITEFQVSKPYVDQFEIHQVGGSIHRELWVQAEELETFNRHIVGYIQIIAAYYGERYLGAKHWGTDLYADALLLSLYHVYTNHPASWTGEFYMNQNAIFLNYRYWESHDYRPRLAPETQAEFLNLLGEMWRQRSPQRRLPEFTG